MYSLTAVGGIQYTTEKMKNNNKMTKSTPKNRTKTQHAFRNIREPIMYNATDNTVLPLSVASNATSVTGNSALCPIGLSSAGLTVSGSSVVVGAQVIVHNPPLRWLMNTSYNFGKYRVTRARLIFVGNQGSTMTGTLVMAGYKDVFDAGNVIQNAYATGPNARTFDLASTSSREVSINIPVDSTWKKVGKVLSANLGTPFTGTAQNYPVQANTANDLCFGAFAVNAYGVPPLSNAYSVGTLFLDYDVEFGDPESSSVNV